MNDIEYLRKYLKDKDLDTALKELESGIPVQYIVGNTNFYGYDFKVNRNTLIPRFETELLVEKTYNYIKKYFNKDNIKILDIGTGSGCIAITLNKLLNSCDITGIDISSEALEVAKENNIINNTNSNKTVYIRYSFSDNDFKLILNILNITELKHNSNNIIPMLLKIFLILACKYLDPRSFSKSCFSVTPIYSASVQDAFIATP